MHLHFNLPGNLPSKSGSRYYKAEESRRKKYPEMMKLISSIIKLQTQFLTKYFLRYPAVYLSTSVNKSIHILHLQSKMCSIFKNSIYKIEVEVKEDLILLVTNYCHSSSPHKSWQFAKSLLSLSPYNENIYDTMCKVRGSLLVDCFYFCNFCIDHFFQAASQWHICRGREKSKNRDLDFSRTLYNIYNI